MNFSAAAEPAICERDERENYLMTFFPASHSSFATRKRKHRKVYSLLRWAVCSAKPNLGSRKKRKKNSRRAQAESEFSMQISSEKLSELQLKDKQKQELFLSFVVIADDFGC
jgi:hypothetical protein